MKIKDIVNRDIVNLTNCDQEPIHIPGSIQPHGFLLAFTDPEFIIEFCSANTTSFIELPPVQLLGKKISAAFGEPIQQQINAHLPGIDGNTKAPLLIEFNHKKFYCSIHKSGACWIGEFEPVLTELPGATAIYDQTVQFVAYLQQAQTLQQLCAKIADEIRTLTGYDRVMVYRFDKDYNGEVYAESKRADIESFFGLHYPHTDIPVQARQLYIKNLLRLIVDINYQPVALLTIDNSADKNLDLSLSTLRSVSPIHVQYLQNMGVGATLTISLLHEGRLWGLVACHHYAEKYIDHFTRISAQLQGHFLTSQINMREISEEYAIAEKVNASLERLLNQTFSPDMDSLNGIVNQPELLSVCNASGVSILLNGVLYKAGIVPREQEITDIALWAMNNHQTVFSTSRLADFYTSARDCPTASGIIFCSLGTRSQSCILWFNPETLEEVYWAGEPDKAIIKDSNGLHPRKSFDAWKQITKCQARPWAKPEVTAATNFAYSLQKHITLILLTQEEKQQRELTEELKNSNAELENINWLSTHDLKEPLRKIQMFSSKLIDSEKHLSENANKAVKKMGTAAARMQRLIEDLMTYSRVRRTSEAYEHIKLQEVVETIIDELLEDPAGKEASIHINTSLPDLQGVPVLIHELFMNLLSNALKFSRAHVVSKISIACSLETMSFETDLAPKQYCMIAIKDNGIGFDEQYQEDIFKIFAQLNTPRQAEGSGVGLALCRKIMQIHNGFIRATGKQEAGAEFQLYFPFELMAP